MLEKVWPPGYMPAEEAILKIAEAVDAGLWSENSVPDWEQDLWRGVNAEFSGEYLRERIDALQATRKTLDLRCRQQSFEAALRVIRDSLYTGALTSFGLVSGWPQKVFLDHFHVVEGDDHLHFDEQAWTRNNNLELVRIDRSSWCDATRSERQLLSGLIQVSGERGERLILFGHDEIASHAAGYQAQAEEERSLFQEDGSAATRAPPREAYLTGAPGRPTPMQFVVDEFERRVAAAALEATAADQGKALHSWCATNHPNVATPSPKAIENKIRAPFRLAKDGPPKL